jgi:hypothetical protein
MPCNLSVAAFKPVRDALWSVPEGALTGKAMHNPLGELFLSPENLHFIFCSYVDQYEAESGWQIDADSHRLDAFTTIMYDQYVAGACRFMPHSRTMSKLEQAQLVQRWNEHTIQAIVGDALKAARRKAAYLRRVRDPLYGMREPKPIQVAKPHAERMEQVFRDNYAELGATRLPPPAYRTAVPDD